MWQWSFWNHLVQNYLPSGQTFYTNSAGQTVYVSDYGSVNSPNLLNANCGSHTIQYFNHMNSVDYNPALNEFVISARNQCEIYVIDASTTSDQAATGSGGNQGLGGNFLYRWGNNANYGGAGPETLFQQHSAQWIAAGLPGAGDLLIFDDGDNRTPVPYTSVDEITPPVTATGAYTLLGNGTYGPTADTWQWNDTPTTAFYNSDGGGCQRLPNGDTLICFGTRGLVFEVNQAGKIDWEYQNGDAGSAAGGTSGGDGILYQGDSLPADPNLAGGYTTTLFRAPWYSPSFVAAFDANVVASSSIEKYRDWFELYNYGMSAVSLGGMYLTNTSSDPTLWQIPSGVSIAAGSDVIFYADGETSATTAAGRHASFTLSAAGGSIYLYNSDGATLLGSMTYPALAANVAYVATSLSFSSTSVVGAYGGTTSLSATLTDGGLAISNKTVRFSIDGSAVGTATTNASGVATLAGVGLAGLQAGTHIGYVQAAFVGDGTDAAGNAVTNLVVSQLTWNAGANGNWASGDWTGVPTNYPGSTADAVINTPYTVSVNSPQYAYSLEVGGDGQVAIGAGGTLTVGADAAVSSASAIDVLAGGTLALAGLDAGTGTGSVYLDGGTLQADGSFTTAVPLTIDTGGATIDSASYDVALASTVTGLGKLTKTGAGVATLSGTNTYAGGTQVADGTLMIAAADALPSGGNLVIADGATVILSMGDAGASDFSVPGSASPVASFASPTIAGTARPLAASEDGAVAPAAADTTTVVATAESTAPQVSSPGAALSSAVATTSTPDRNDHTATPSAADTRAPLAINTSEAVAQRLAPTLNAGGTSPSIASHRVAFALPRGAAVFGPFRPDKRPSSSDPLPAFSDGHADGARVLPQQTEATAAYFRDARFVFSRRSKAHPAIIGDGSLVRPLAGRIHDAALLALFGNDSM